MRLSELERIKLIGKIEKASHLTDEEIGGGCLINALSLYDQNGGGEIFWVSFYEGISIQHAYYLPPDFDDDKIALNQSDAGYSQYPALTGKELREVGQLQNINILRMYSR